MSPLDITYLLMLVLSIPYGLLVKRVNSTFMRQILCLSAGLLIVILLVGVNGAVHSFTTIAVNFIILKVFSYRNCSWISVLFTFSYLLFYRTCEQFGFPKPPQHSNAVQLLVTVRMISLAFELHDELIRSEKKDDSVVKIRNEFNTSISILDTFAYGYCYIGLMTGPFYTYKTFNDMLKQDSANINTLEPAIMNLKFAPIIAVGYLYLKSQFPTSYLESDECLKHPYGSLYVVFVSIVTFMWFHWRFYVGWLLAESMCMSCGLGAYPREFVCKPGAGPTGETVNPKELIHCFRNSYNFETIRNINILEFEFSTSFQMSLRNWNMTIQWWIREYIYKRLPFKSHPLKVAVSFFISCYWHGIHSGYYLTGFCYVIAIMSDVRLDLSMKPYIKTAFQQQLWLLFKKVYTYSLVAFVFVPFQFLTYDVSIKIWEAMCYWGLFSMLFLNVVASVI